MTLIRFYDIKPRSATSSNDGSNSDSNSDGDDDGDDDPRHLPSTC